MLQNLRIWKFLKIKFLHLCSIILCMTECKMMTLTNCPIQENLTLKCIILESLLFFIHCWNDDQFACNSDMLQQHSDFIQFSVFCLFFILLYSRLIQFKNCCNVFGLLHQNKLLFSYLDSQGPIVCLFVCFPGTELINLVLNRQALCHRAVSPAPPFPFLRSNKLNLRV